MLKLVGITKEYRIDDTDVTIALKDISIEFRQNEFVSILGPSGCGKTTLLNIIGGLDRYNAGDIQIDGISTKEYDDVDWDTYRNQRIGFVFQSYNLIPHMNILKNVALCLTLAGVSKEERNERALEALRKVGLDSQAKKRPNQLSGGQMQRVAIARALVNNPDIILADEPTGALDTESGLQIMELLKEVASDRLVVMVTHNPQLADEYSTRIVYLKDGEIVDDTMPYNSSADEAVLEEIAEEESVEVADTEAVAENVAEEAVAENVAEEAVAPEESEVKVDKAPAPKKRRKKSLKERIRKYVAHDKASMKLSTAISLSWNNLISKKGRTFLTSIAGSIGIIGIILVLALSTGAKMFLSGMEEDALSTYPLAIEKSSMDVTSVISSLMSGGEACEEHVDVENNETKEAGSDQFCDECYLDLSKDYDVTIQSIFGSVMENIAKGDIVTDNDLVAFKKYVDEHFDDKLATVKFNYGTIFNAYCEDPASETNYMKVNPYIEAMYIVIDELKDDPQFGEMFGMINFNGMSFDEAMTTFGEMLGNSWAEMSTNQEILSGQYDVKAGRWPQNEKEIVIVLNDDGKLMDIQLFMLGLKSPADIMTALGEGKSFSSTGLMFDEDLLGREYKILTNADYLVENVDAEGYLLNAKGNRVKDKDNNEILVADVDAEGFAVDASGNRFFDKNNDPIPMTWDYKISTTNNKEFVDSQSSMSVKVVGVVQPKPDAIATSINGCIGYTKALSDYLMKQASGHPAIVRQNAIRLEKLEDDADANAYEGVIRYSYPEGKIEKKYEIGDDVRMADHETLMRQLGVADPASPMSIHFYCNSFASKEGVEEFIAQYNKEVVAHNEALKAKLDNKEITLEEYDAQLKTEIQYTDTLSSVMGFVNTMTNVITGVLIAFAAISLVVSTIMIAIIIYTSVLERRKEIGVLRSIGARKKDVARVFLAESAILGGYSGIIGVVVSWLLSLGISAVLEHVFGFVGLMKVEWWHAVMMLGISILLSMLAGFIPSRIAAKKDPAIALRSE